jgi:HEAT repeat protein
MERLDSSPARDKRVAGGPLGFDEVGPLVDALHDPVEEVRTGALRALVRLLLHVDVWFWIGRFIWQELWPPGSSDKPSDRQPEPAIPRHELIEAAVYVPVAPLRKKLRDLAQQGTEEERRITAHALARARDQAALPQLMADLSSGEEGLRAAAAESLSLLDLASVQREVRRQARRDANGDVRFWLAIALARLGDGRSIKRVLMDLERGSVDASFLWGDPMVLSDRLIGRGPFPDQVSKRLLRIGTNERLDIRWLAMDLFHAAGRAPGGKDGARVETSLSEPTALLDPLLEQRARELATAYIAESPFDESGALPWEEAQDLAALPAETGSLLIPALFAHARYTVDPMARTGAGNAIMQLPKEVWQRLEPDVPALLEIYLSLDDNDRYLGWQLAWAVSRAGLRGALQALTPCLSEADDAQRSALIRLIQEVILYVGTDYGPIFGGGSAPSDITPNIETFFDPEEGREATLVEEAPPKSDTRRLGVDAFLDDKLLEHALVTDRKTVVEVSIGPEGMATKQLTEPVDLDFGDRDLLSLPVRFVLHDGTDMQQIMRVRRDPATQAFVTFEVTPTGTHFSAHIVVYKEDGSTVIEAAWLSAAVVATEEDQQRWPETIRLVRVPVSGLAEPITDAVGSVVTDGERAVVATPEIPIRATPEAAVAGVAPLKNTFRTAARNYVAMHGDFDITAALVAAAQAGYRLRSRLGLDALRDLDRIQVVSFYAQSPFPLELVYDGEPPPDEATRCDGWQQALATGTCPSCGDTADASRICPLRFWGLSKVIEHYMGGNTPGNIPFAARRQRISKDVAAPSSTVIGASVKVIEALAKAGSADTDRETLLADVVAGADELGVTSVVHDWKEWRTAIGRTNPNLLVAMPHQGTKNGVPALELGGELETTFVEGHVRKAGDTVRPIVLLLGCDTSTAEDMIGSFATDMRPYASVVVATIGKVVAEEAPFVASIVIDSLKQAMRLPGATIGTAILEARRALLARSRVVGLLLVGHGDARWEV